MKTILTEILIQTQVIDFNELRNMLNNRIAGFWGEYRWLSNFWLCDIHLNGITFPSVEHAYVYSKVFIDEDAIVDLLACSPGDAKRIGKKLQLKPNFEANKVEIMRGLLLKKFSIPSLQQKLLETDGCSLMELNNWGDRFWGVDEQGNGLNTLGQLLEEVREHYK